MPPSAGRRIEIEIGAAFQPLLQPARYKGIHGGRGSGKSHTAARLEVLRAIAEPPYRTVCAREIQNSLADSAKRLIEDVLGQYGLGEADGFKVYQDRIAFPKDGVCIFRGLQNHTADSLKSLEGFNGCWVEEGHTISQGSLDLLIPTIRKEGSTITITWNPRYDTDPVDLLLRGDNPPTNSIVVKANWDSNPWFPDVLNTERLDCKRRNPTGYPHIWEGEYATVIEGAYYTAQLTEARSSGRIGFVPADPHLPYRAYIDIGGTGGKSDSFCIWIVQFVGLEVRVLNYYEAKGQDAGTHLAWLRSNGYGPGSAYITLPHDGAQGDKVYAVTYEKYFRDAGYTTVEVIPNQGRGAAGMRIEAVRKLFPAIRINESTCGAGLKALGAYKEKIDEARKVGLGPDHDWASHGADAFGLMAVAYRPPVTTSVDYGQGMGF